MGKGIGSIYKYDQRIWPYPYPNNTFVTPQPSDTSIQTQHKSDFDASVGAHNVASAGLYQSTNNHGNTDFKDNDNFTVMFFSTYIHRVIDRQKNYIISPIREYKCFTIDLII